MDEWNSKIKKDEAKKKTTYNWNEEVMKVQSVGTGEKLLCVPKTKLIKQLKIQVLRFVLIASSSRAQIMLDERVKCRYRKRAL